MYKYKPKSDVFNEIFTRIYSKLECNIIYVWKIKIGGNLKCLFPQKKCSQRQKKANMP